MSGSEEQRSQKSFRTDVVEDLEDDQPFRPAWDLRGDGGSIADDELKVVAISLPFHETYFAVVLFTAVEFILLSAWAAIFISVS
ncbi:hypothetical protein IWQ60_001452 [Tieghemiomyces parasiticus]|uniref:Uncharacterized protein n=1 Tax=Tieghemiomyces parasiticus TaxID=78921 RepID=A0A9W8AJW3_9FUNG|nr:hypothetical protein IWQ60_001452 [Tieghemiomyces parasiticus]